MLLHYICDYIDKPIRNLTAAPFMIVIRSFDINKPGIDFKDLEGAIAGGSIL